MLANAGNTATAITLFLSNVRTDLWSLMDQQENVYQSYDPPLHFAPFPRQVIIDQTGVIRYISGQYDGQAVRDMIDSLIE